jgi:hypothetical protein
MIESKFRYRTSRANYELTDELYLPIESLLLIQNYPNPFTSTTTIKYKVTEPGFVSLKVFDVIGYEITTLVNEQKAAGEYTVELNAAGLSNGIYFCRLQAGICSETRKLIVRK